MSRPVVALLDPMPEHSRQIVQSGFGADHDVVFVADDSEAAKADAAREAAVLLTMWGRVSAATVQAAGRCRLIHKLGVGTDKIDVEAAGARGITVLKAAGVNAAAVAELAVLLTLAVARNLPAAMTFAQKGVHAKEQLRVTSYQLAGRRVGLLGLGHIGVQAARRFAAFGTDLRYYDLRRADASVEQEIGVRYAEFDELIETSHVLSIHIPKTPDTGPVIDARALGRARSDLILVNTSRGGLVDEAALAAAVGAGRILGAGLDVTDQEPLPADSPLLGCPRIVLTPHIGGAVADNFPRVVEHALANTRAVLAGRTVAPADIVIDGAVR